MSNGHLICWREPTALHILNCPTVFNPGQEDQDGDGDGDACEFDDDNDGVSDFTDNCRLAYNPSQLNSDGDSLGDACDNCSFVSNEDQKNTDGDSLGNACDNDDDNDMIADASDNCPEYANPRQIDNDNNGMGMWCDVGELALLVGFGEQVELDILWQEIDPLTPARFPVFPCSAGVTCPQVMPEVFRVDVTLELSVGYRVRVIDDRGWELDYEDIDVTGTATLTFDTDAEYYYDDGVSAQAFEGRRYFLELLAPPGMAAGTVVNGTIDVDTTDLSAP